MIAVVPIAQDYLESPLSEKFARSQFFAIINTENGSFQIIENKLIHTGLQLGTELLKWLISEFKVDTLLAFEFGIKVQKMASERRLQLIILNQKDKTLKDIFDLMKIEY